VDGDATGGRGGAAGEDETGGRGGGGLAGATTGPRLAGALRGAVLRVVLRVVVVRFLAGAALRVVFFVVRRLVVFRAVFLAGARLVVRRAVVRRLVVLFLVVRFLAGARLAPALRAVDFRRAGLRVALRVVFFVVRRLVVFRAVFLAGARVVVRRLVVRFLAGARLAPALRAVDFRRAGLRAAFRVVFFVARRALERFAGMSFPLVSPPGVALARAPNSWPTVRPTAPNRLESCHNEGRERWIRPSTLRSTERFAPRVCCGAAKEVGVARRATPRVGETPDAPAAPPSATASSGSERRARGPMHRWRVALATGNAPDGELDWLTRWIVLVRASVLPMTLTAGFVGGLLAWWNEGDGTDGWLWALATVGIVCAHMANNLMNDLFDLEVGTDSESYPRALYAPHPVLSGMTTRRGLAIRALALNVLDLAILVVLVVERGWPIAAFALGGFALSVAYTAPPLRLKKHGLGEPTVLIVWGPLMVGGVYYAATGSITWDVVLASLPYALLCTAVLMGKHIDKIPWDEPAGTRTLPVILGEKRARATTLAMMTAFYPLVVLLVVVGTLPVLSLVCLAGIARLVKVWTPFRRPKPAAPPEGFPIWPLWFAAIAFVHTRLAGGLLVLGMLLGVIIGF
jgi:1,4-dihydroxy-2-naphthoate polyprenyltransferase